MALERRSRIDYTGATGGREDVARAMTTEATGPGDGLKELGEHYRSLVDGEVVVSDGMVRTADQDDLVARAGDAADAAWKRFAECYGGYSVAPPN